jgi:hypothetical protein
VPGTPVQTQLPVPGTPGQAQLPLPEGGPHLRRSPRLSPSHPKPVRRPTPRGDTSSSTESEAKTDTRITDAARASAHVPQLLILAPRHSCPAAITQSQYVSHLPQQEPPVGVARLLVQKELKKKAEARERALAKASVKLAKEQVRT